MSDISGVLIFAGVFWIGAAVGVGLDARKYGGDGLKWFLIVLTTGVFGLVFYAVAHKDTNSANTNSEHVLRVRGEVIDIDTEEKHWVQLAVKSESTTSAIRIFEEECRGQGYQPIREPEVQLKKQTGQ